MAAVAMPRSIKLSPRGRTGLARLAVTLALGLLCACAEPRPESSTNVLLITVDTLRADHLGSYGHRLPTSPRIDRLAARGVRFADCTAQWPKTTPSMASLMTSAYPKAIGIGDTFRRLSPSLRLLGELFQDAGYATAAVVGNFNVGETVGFDQGFEHFVESWRKRWRELHGLKPFRNRAGKVKRYTNGTIITDEALDWLEVRDSQRPFFLWLHYMDPHGPYVPPARYAELFVGEYEQELVDLDKLPRYQIQTAANGGPPIRDVGFYRAQYAREIRYLDDELGRLLDGLSAMGLLADTLTVLTADHGESLGEHDYYLEHGRYSYQVNAHVPLIFHWPSALPSRRVVEQPVGLIDVAPTILELSGLPRPDNYEGTSLAPLVRAVPRASGPSHTFMESGRAGEQSQLTVRRGPWKLIQVRHPQDRREMTGAAFELYNLEEDPGETVNLAAERPEVVRNLVRVLEEWYHGGEAIDGGLDLDPESLDPEQVKLLQALGYLD